MRKKLNEDLAKVESLIQKYGYSSSFDFYCNEPLTDQMINECRKYAIDRHQIELNIYDGNRLVDLECKPLHDYLLSFLPSRELSDQQTGSLSLLGRDVSPEPHFEKTIYKESNLEVSDLFINPVYSLQFLSYDGDVVCRHASNSAIQDCKGILQDRGLLLIKGPYGCGKTILSKALYGELLKEGFCVCFPARSVKKGVFENSKERIKKCIDSYHKLFVFIDSAELLLEETDVIQEISDLLDDFKGKIHFIINYRSILDNESDSIWGCFCMLQSPAVLTLSYFSNEAIQLWLKKYNDTRIASKESVVTYADIQAANKNLRISCKNPLILYMVSSNENAKQHLSQKNWFGVFQEFVDKTIGGKYVSEKGLNPFFDRHGLNKKEYFCFLARVAGTISRDSVPKVIMSQVAQEDDFFLDSNVVRYSINTKTIERFVPKRITQAYGSRSTEGQIPESLVQTLNCYFFEVNETSCCFKDNNILFFFKAYNYTQALKEAIRAYNDDLGKLKIGFDRLSSAASGMIIDPVEIEFILNFIQNSGMTEAVQGMIYALIYHGYILNIENTDRCKVDYELIKTETLLCIIYMKFFTGNYSSHKMAFYFKRLSQYHSFAKLVDPDLSSIIQRYFSKITIAQAEFRRINLKNYNFNGSSLNNTKFIQCKLDSSSIKNISCKNTTFDMCLITNIKDGNASVSGTITFQGCKLKDVTIRVNKTDVGTRLVFEKCVIDHLKIYSDSEQKSVRVFVSFNDCVIQQCDFKVNNLFLSVPRSFLDSPITIVCEYLRFFLGQNVVASGKLLEDRCKEQSKAYATFEDLESRWDYR